MIDNKKIRIRLYGEHLGYISNDLYSNFLRITSTLDYSSWVKKTAFSDFGLYLTSKDSILDLKDLVKENYFEDISDWLREKMRVEINKIKNKK